MHSLTPTMARAGACTLVLLMLAGATPAAGQTIRSTTPPQGVLSPSLANEVNAAVDRALNWLAAAQKDDGSWSNGDFPALTALPLWAFTRAPHPGREAVVAAAKRYILSCVQQDGSIYRKVAGRKGGGLSNYNTAICMTALHAMGDASLVPVVQGARRFLANGQHLGGDVYKGGFGYDARTGRAYADLLNTYYAAQAMKLTADVEDQRPKSEARADLDWKSTVQFVERLQNKPESGDENAGGFFYNPTDPKAGTTTNASGVVFFRSYGSITYAGLLSLVYADVPRTDARVLSALDWVARHWSLDENPGMGEQGMYFFYSVLSRALAACGQDLIPAGNGQYVNWKVDLARKLVSLQRVDPNTGHGYWKNDTGRYWENDAVLVTSYALLSLLSL